MSDEGTWVLHFLKRPLRSEGPRQRGRGGARRGPEELEVDSHRAPASKLSLKHQVSPGTWNGPFRAGLGEAGCAAQSLESSRKRDTAPILKEDDLLFEADLLVHPI